jgi:hypothetical protein
MVAQYSFCFSLFAVAGSMHDNRLLQTKQEALEWKNAARKRREQESQTGIPQSTCVQNVLLNKCR